MDFANDDLKVVITGITGLVGNTLAKYLQDLNPKLEIHGTGSGDEQKLPGLEGRIQPSDFFNIDWDKIGETDVLIHLGGITDSYCKDERALFRVNVDGSMNVINEAIKHGCKTIVYASSTAVYGQEQAPYVEGVTELKPINPYGESKKALEGEVRNFLRKEGSGINIVGLRLCSLYGPGEDHKGIMASMPYKLAQQMAQEKNPEIFEFGEQKRDYLYTKDVAQMLVRAAETQVSGIFNAGSGNPITFNYMLEALNRVLLRNNIIPRELKPRYITNPSPETYQVHIECDMSLAREKLGLEQQFSFEEGFQDYLDTGRLLAA